MWRSCAVAAGVTLLIGCGRKANPIVGDWDMNLGGRAAAFSRMMKLRATFDPDGTATVHYDIDYGTMYTALGTGSTTARSSGKPSWVHETLTGRYTYEKDTLTIRMFEQQIAADDPKYQKMMGKAEGAKSLSKPVNSKVTWKSADEFTGNLDGDPVTFKRVNKSLF